MHLFNFFLSEHRTGLNGKGWTLVVLLALASGLAGYLFMKPRACPGFVIYCNDRPVGDTNLFYVNAAVAFSAGEGAGNNISWDFGDQTPKSIGARTTHFFTAPGQFTVRAIYQAKCITVVQVIIRDQVAALVADKAGRTVIQSPDVLLAGQSLNLDAAYGKWRLINVADSQVQQVERGRVTFTTPGTRILELRTEKDSPKVYRKEIRVVSPPASAPVTTHAPARPAATPVPKIENTWDEVEHAAPKAPPAANSRKEVKVEPTANNTVWVIADQELKDKLNDIIANQEHAQNLVAYLCGGLGTRVLANKQWSDMQSFCRMVENNKRYEVTAVEAVRDSRDNCINYIKITFKKAFLSL
ncbi:PKD domain-containing protein [Taibaiella koreensis]|uniref:PKD domain-containing protein n=1 Tax=Taibaiella koreensis TaxID=1268548 RepID=UPI000E59C244|nr:PKD domain-containing protein [Taibaiella koreensis]